MAIQTEKKRRLFRKLLDRDGNTCHYCGKLLIETELAYHPDGRSIDHIDPVINGGEDKLENLVLACRNCNARKGKKHYQEYKFMCDVDGIIKFMMDYDNE